MWAGEMACNPNDDRFEWPNPLRHRAATAPSGPMGIIPPILRPPATIHRPDLFFETVRRGSENDRNMAAVGMRRAFTEMPGRGQWPYDTSYPVNASPEPMTAPLPSLPLPSNAMNGQFPFPDPYAARDRQVERLSAQEEEDLAHAVAESMRMALPHELVERERMISADAEFARRLAAEDHRLLEDEAFARDLAEQEEIEKRKAEAEATVSPSHAGPSSAALPTSSAPHQPLPPPPPPPPPRISPPPMPMPQPYLPSPTMPTPVSPSPPDYLQATTPLPQLSPNPAGIHRVSPTNPSPSDQRASAYFAAAEPIRDREDSMPSPAQTASSPSISSSDDRSDASPNQFVDAELLHGVSMGFFVPDIGPQVPMPSALPNIITLPHGRCPPLHIMAPTWRHLLKLMARLAGTRVEPTVEALAQTKDVLRLRVVVQFIRNPPERREWCTVLWFTVDHPVPSDLPATAAFSSTDTLPFSYTTNLTHMNALLRSGVDTATSKLYTIPATATVPYPTLPISFPNLALYLQAALDEARRTDKRLARMVDTCFPTYTEPPEVEQQGRVGGLFRKALGKRKNKPQQARTANEDTYDLVTPFMSDEWG